MNDAVVMHGEQLERQKSFCRVEDIGSQDLSFKSIPLGESQNMSYDIANQAAQIQQVSQFNESGGYQNRL